MHVYFSGIGGTAIGPLALIAKEAGLTVSGSDKQASNYIDYLKKHGLKNIHIGQTRQQIAAIHGQQAIDWFVYTSALTLENPHPPELEYCREMDIKTSKRDEFLNFILQKKHLRLIAIAGTYGKTTTTAMVIWLFSRLKLPISYSVGAKMAFGDMGQYDTQSQYFIYEADEFDRNFLAFEPYLSLIVGVSWDHHEIFPRREDYQAAFREFILQSQYCLLWREDANYLELDELSPNFRLQDSSNPKIERLKLKGHYNRLDAWLAIQATHIITKEPIDKLILMINDFPGIQRRMEQIAPNLYSDYAHTPDKIKGALSVAFEMAAEHDQAVIIIYEPLTNRRQHYIIDDYQDCFAGTTKVYWLPSYLAREDPNQRIIPPQELIDHLTDHSLAEPAMMNKSLKQTILKHLSNGDIVIGLSGGGGSSLDEWLRKEFQPK